jgi:hypothetical protein
LNGETLSPLPRRHQSLILSLSAIAAKLFDFIAFAVCIALHFSFNSGPFGIQLAAFLASSPSKSAVFAWRPMSGPVGGPYNSAGLF